MDLHKTLIAAAVGTAFLASGPAFAKHDDSVHSWGPWGHLSPAAGGNNVGLLNFLSRYGYRPETGVDNTLHGYATYGSAYNAEIQYCGQGCTGQGMFPFYVPASAEVSWAPPTEASGGVPTSASVTVAALEQQGVFPPFSSGTMTGNGDSSGFDVSIDYSDGGEGWAWGTVIGEVVIGGWAYETAAEEEGFDSECIKCGNFVFGTPTPVAAIQQLAAGNVTATYNGFTAYFGNSVSITAHFGSGTWNGSWNGGANGGFVATGYDASGHLRAGGQIGFNASGNIVGSSIVSTSVSATDSSNVAGSVNGGFFGSNASTVAGIYDITKDGARSVDVFAAAR